VLFNDLGPYRQAGELVPGTIYRAEITGAHDYGVVGRIVE
jgi:hypothetical protein